MYQDYPQNYQQPPRKQVWSERIPFERSSIEFIPQKSVEYVPQERTYTDYIELEHQIDHIPVPRYEKKIDYIPVDRYREDITYEPFQRSEIVHNQQYPMQSSMRNSFREMTSMNQYQPMNQYQMPIQAPPMTTMEAPSMYQQQPIQSQPAPSINQQYYQQFDSPQQNYANQMKVSINSFQQPMRQMSTQPFGYMQTQNFEQMHESLGQMPTQEYTCPYYTQAQPFIQMQQPYGQMQSLAQSQPYGQMQTQMQTQPFGQMLTQNIGQMQSQPVMQIQTYPVTQIQAQPVLQMTTKPVVQIQTQPVQLIQIPIQNQQVQVQSQPIQLQSLLPIQTQVIQSPQRFIQPQTNFTVIPQQQQIMLKPNVTHLSQSYLVPGDVKNPLNMTLPTDAGMSIGPLNLRNNVYLSPPKSNQQYFR